MKVEIISLEGCSAAVATRTLASEIAADLDLDIELLSITVRTVEEAVRHRHIGGPTVHVNGLDIEPEARGIDTFSLA